MPVHRILMFALIALLLYFVISQILVPAIRGTKLFPRFRREAKLKEEIFEANQELYESELEDDLEERRRKLDAESELAATKPAHDTSPHN